MRIAILTPQERTKKSREGLFLNAPLLELEGDSNVDHGASANLNTQSHTSYTRGMSHWVKWEGCGKEQGLVAACLCSTVIL